MANGEGTYQIMSTGPDAVTLRTMRRMTVAELCHALQFSHPVRRRVIAQGRLRHLKDGQPLRADSQLDAAEDVVLVLERPTAKLALADEPVEVMWQDRFALVANKPAGLLVHGDGTGAPTLTARVQTHLARMASEREWPFVPVAQPLNRLDVETSGIVLFSLTKEFQPPFDALVAGHGGKLHKRYLAIVEGAFPGRPFTMCAPIARDRHHANRMRVSATGKPAQTRVVRLAQGDGRSLVACELLTGRRHQIRVHLAHEGHPIVGDPLYGAGNGARTSLLMLHAYDLEFTHPVTDEPIMLHTDWPQRFTKLFAAHDVNWSILDAT